MDIVNEFKLISRIFSCFMVALLNTPNHDFFVNVGL
jgi:hypothetical protein